MTIPDDDLPDPRTAQLLRGVKRDVQPGRDLWPGIEGRLRRRGRGAQGRRVWYIGSMLAAAAAVAFFLFRTPAMAPTESSEVRAMLAATTGAKSATAKSLAHHLEIIDAAVAETARALEATPGDPALAEFLANLEQRRLALLAQAARFAAES
jgi:hypothetical protein